MSGGMRFTSFDLEVLQIAEGKRYEIIEGELYVSAQPHYRHQLSCTSIVCWLSNWGLETNLGEAVYAPGLIFADDDDVAPDVV